MENFSLVDIPVNPTSPKAKSSRGKHSLWRFYSNDGTLLYVSTRPNATLLMKKDWWYQVASATIKHFDSLDAIADAKAVAVYNEDPIYNSHGRPTEI